GTRRFGFLQRHRGFLFVGFSLPDGSLADKRPAPLPPVYRIPARPVPASSRTQARRIPHHRSLKHLFNGKLVILISSDRMAEAPPPQLFRKPGLGVASLVLVHF